MKNRETQGYELHEVKEQTVGYTRGKVDNSEARETRKSYSKSRYSKKEIEAKKKPLPGVEKGRGEKREVRENGAE